MSLIRSSVFSLLISCGAVLAQSGTGLTGKYYDNTDFTSLKTTRTDATLDFSWGSATPSGTALTSGDTFSVAWSGQIEPEFSELYTFYFSADDTGRLWINDELIVARTIYQNPIEMRGQIRLKAGHKVNIRVEYMENTGNTRAKLEWSSASLPRQLVPTNRLYPTTEIPNGGAVMRELWHGLAGANIATLTSNTNYPNKPASRELLTSFECLARDWEDGFGTRVTGFIRAPLSGSYTFAVSGDEVVQLYLSTDANPANKSLIASTTTATAFRDFAANASQQSAPRTLVAGQRYYVELLHKEDSGADHWSVAWKQPGEAAFSIIPGTALMQPGVDTAQPSTSNFFNTLCTEQPRLGVSRERLLWLKQMWQSPLPSAAKTRAQSVINAANNDLNAAPDSGRHGRDRLQRLAVAWWLTGDTRYPEYAWTSIINHAINNGDWADPWKGVTNGVIAIGYDWFYPYWSSTRRTTMTNKMVAGFNGGWTNSYSNNIGVLINCGHMEAMLAVGMVNESAAEGKMGSAIGRLNPKVAEWNANAGAWYEGTDYGIFTKWAFGQAMPAMEMALGSTFGLSKIAGVSSTAREPLNIASNNRQRFTFSDVGTGSHNATGWANWWARRYGAHEVYDFSRQVGNSALNALYVPETTISPAISGMNPDTAFRGPADASGGDFCEVVTMRQNWTDPKATFVGGMGGTYESHGHLQSGTFQLSARGVKWFIDLSSENYDVKNHNTTTPNSTGVDRWDYYRWRAEGHNCLVVNPTAGPDRIWNAPPAPLINYQSAQNGQRSFAVWDLSDNISGVTKVQRGLQLFNNRKEVLVQDEIVLPSAGTAWWYAHFQSTSTPPAISPDGKSVVLTSGSERLWGKIVSGNGVWTVRPASALIQTNNPPVADTPNNGRNKLAIQLTGVTNTTLAVWFVPLAPGENPPVTTPVITPLSSWNLTEQNEAPVASNGFASIGGVTPLDVNLRPFATDDWTPAERLTFVVSNPVGGTLSLLPDGFTARFTPTSGFNGTQSFTFIATDDEGETSTPASITITVTPVVSTWSNTAGGNWSTAGNWQESTPPVGGRGADLRFFSGQSVPSGTINISNNIGGTFDANQLHFSGTGTSTTVVNLSGNPLRLVRNGEVTPAITLTGITSGYRYNIANSITLADDVTINANNSGTFVFNGTIGGSGGLTRSGLYSTLVLSGDNTYSGTTNINSGTLQIGNDGATGTLGSGPVSIGSGATLRIDRTGALEIPNDISGSGSLLLHNPSVSHLVQLTGSNTFTGEVRVTGGTLLLTDASQLGSGAKNIILNTASSALRLNGSAGDVVLPAEFSLITSNENNAITNEVGNNVIEGPITLTSGGGNTRIVSTAGTLTLNGSITPNTTARTLDLRGAGNGVINGNILDAAAPNTLAGIAKSEAGTWILNGNNSITGNTSVSGGSLFINGQHSTGAVSVSSGATLGGRGNILAPITVNGTLSPGDGFGTLQSNNTLSFGSTSRLRWELGSNTLSGDQAITSGAVTVTSGARIDAVLNAAGSTVNYIGSFWRSPRSFPVITGSTLTGSFTLGTVSTDSGGRATATYGSFSLQHTSTGVNLVWTPIPGFPVINEPEVSILSPATQPASVIDETHSLRVIATTADNNGVTWNWSMVSGPEAVSFDSSNKSDTHVNFIEAGTYVLRVSATNQVGTTFHDLTVEVSPSPSVTSIREGVDGALTPTTFIRSDNTTWNSGARDQFVVGKNPGAFRGLLSFPVSAVPANSWVTDATLDLTICAVGSGSTIEPLNIHALHVPYIEGAGDGLSTSNGTGTGADWLNRSYSPATAWVSSGAGLGTDFGAEILGTAEAFNPTTTPDGTVISFDFTPSFATTVASRVAAGGPVRFLVKGANDTAGTNGFVRIASEDHPTVDWRPRLNITYHDHLAPIIDPGEAPAATVGNPVVLTGTITHGTGLGWTLVSGPGPVFITHPTANGATLLFTRPGTHVFRLSAGNAHGESSRTLEIVATGTAMTGLEIWRMQHFGNMADNDSIDSNKDGETNLLEFATGQNPHTNTLATTGIGRDGANLVFTYNRSKAAILDGVTFTVEWSDTLQANSWSHSGVFEEILDDGSVSQTIQASLPRGTSGKRFVRLRVTGP
ncbi:MAG: PA14 domain-containing protein [Akkermansiaceae bacterium]|nr:PA14 domain-containing protein [Akkermansiaceae bacterium]